LLLLPLKEFCSFRFFFSFLALAPMRTTCCPDSWVWFGAAANTSRCRTKDKDLQGQLFRDDGTSVQKAQNKQQGLTGHCQLISQQQFSQAGEIKSIDVRFGSTRARNTTCGFVVGLGSEAIWDHEKKVFVSFIDIAVRS